MGHITHLSNTWQSKLYPFWNVSELKEGEVRGLHKLKKLLPSTLGIKGCLKSKIKLFNYKSWEHHSIRFFYNIPLIIESYLPHSGGPFFLTRVIVTTDLKFCSLSFTYLYSVITN